MAFINTQEVRDIRNALKAAFKGELKFSVRNSNHSEVCVSITSGTVDFTDIMSDGNVGINQFHLYQYGKHQPMFEKILKIIKTGSENKWFDKSDSQTDYFHTAFYINIEVGKWDKPYEYTGA